MLGRFGAAKLHAIQEALTGENAADLDTMLIEGARDWFARVDGITPEALDEAVMGKGGGKPTEKFKEQIRDHMERTGRSGFARTRCPSVEGRRHPAAEPLGLPTKGVG